METPLFNRFPPVEKGIRMSYLKSGKSLKEFSHCPGKAAPGRFARQEKDLLKQCGQFTIFFTIFKCKITIFSTVTPPKPLNNVNR